MKFPPALMFLSGLSFLIQLGSCAIPEGPSPAPVECELRVSPASDIVDSVRAAGKRIEDATGCRTEIADEGIPVHFGYSVTKNATGQDCGAVPVLLYNHPREVKEVQAVELDDTGLAGCDLWPLESTIVHELFHAFVAFPGAATIGDHAESGVFNPYVANADGSPRSDRINEDTLNYFCSFVHCTSYQPE